MKILHVSTEGLGNGGVQSVIMNICRNLKDVHFDILLFTNERRHYDDEFEELGGVIFRIPNYVGKNQIRRKLDYYTRFFRVFLGTYKLLKKNGDYDVIHCHNDLESAICNLAAFFAGIKIRISHAHTAHNLFSEKNIIGNIYKKILQTVMNLTTNVRIGCTKSSFISVFGEKELNKKNSDILPNSIDTVYFHKNNSNNNSTDINIVHVGRYSKNKNQMFLIDIMTRILKEIPNAKLQLIGFDENYQINLYKKVGQLNITANVEFLPHNTNVKEILENASLFIFPSIKEGFGLALLEAQAMEVSCLVSDSVPIEVNCGLCKFLSLSEKVEVWSEVAIKILRNNYDLKLDIQKLGQFDMDNHIKRINHIYLEGEKFESRNFNVS